MVEKKQQQKMAVLYCRLLYFMIKFKINDPLQLIRDKPKEKKEVD